MQISTILDHRGQPMLRPAMAPAVMAPAVIETGPMAASAQAGASSGATGQGTQALPQRPWQTAYSGASKSSRHIGLWRPRIASVNTEVLRDAETIRARARDLFRNHPSARQAVRTMVQGVCGHRLRLALRPNYKYLGIDSAVATAWARITEQLWESYAHGSHFMIDASRRQNFTDLIRTAIKSRIIDGEALMALEWDENRPWSTCFRAVDVDRLDQPYGKPARPEFRGGIELDRFNGPVAYHIREIHPGDGDIAIDGRQIQWNRVIRQTPWGRPVMLHFFGHDRPEQIRGVSEFTTVIQLMKMSEEYAQAELATARAQANVVATVTSDMSYADVGQMLGADTPLGDDAGGNAKTDLALDHLESVADYHNETGLLFDGQKIAHLMPGEKLELATAGHPTSQYADYQSHLDKRTSAGLGTDPTALSQNYSDVSYSAARMSHAHNWRAYETLRQDSIDNVAMPMFHAWLEEGVSKGIIEMPGGLSPTDYYAIKDHLTRGTFITAGRPMIDPTKERAAQKTALEMGVMTLEEIAANEGKDWEEVLEQFAREIEKLRELGIDPWERKLGLAHLGLLADEMGTGTGTQDQPQ